jgi:starch-binding outer membrane protein, SusD/RagB family
MKYNRNWIMILLGILGMTVSCSDFLDPMLDGSLTEDQVYQNAAYFNGVLNTVYSNVPTQYDKKLDCATDNAVINIIGNNYYRLANQNLSPNFNPTDNWTSNFLQIRRINQFLERMVLNHDNPHFLTPVRFRPLHTVNDSIDNINTFYRMLGEAYFLRAFFQFELLRAFGGEGVNGQMLGFPIVTRVLKVDENLNLARNTYMECVRQIVNDCDSAAKYLPLEYRGTNAVLGQTMNGRASGIAALALKARTLLYAASPAYNQSGDVQLWEEAAIAAGDAIKAIGGLQNLAPYENYHFTQLNNQAFQIRDIFFRGNVQGGNRAFESRNYPPGMYGSGEVNPSQNYVNAFPDRNGFPISESTLYNADNPYAERDPRLNLYVAVNESRLGPGNYYTVQTYEGGRDAPNPARKNSRTGYYLKKLLRPGTVQLIASDLRSTARAAIHLGAPELYLNFAEAAFEAWGPTGDPKAYGYTAQTVLARVLLRYGAGNQYLNTVAINDNNKFRELVRNERRLELSFEGHYFWDIRRWATGNDVSALNTQVYGVRITRDGSGAYQYDLSVPLESRVFSTQYMPISYQELYKASNLIQNKGW